MEVVARAFYAYTTASMLRYGEAIRFLEWLDVEYAEAEITVYEIRNHDANFHSEVEAVKSVET